MSDTKPRNPAKIAQADCARLTVQAQALAKSAVPHLADLSALEQMYLYFID